MTFKTLTLEINEMGIARLALTRPEKHHALDEQMMRELILACDRIEANPDVRGVILHSEGRIFCAGGDLGWMREQASLDRTGKIAGARLLADMLRRLDELAVPLIVRVQGNAFGGGLGMMAVADIVIVAEDAVFALTETRLGLIPATIGPYVIRRIGEGHARRLFLNAYRFGASEALRYGLASRTVPKSALDDAVEAEIRLLLECAPGAVADAKRLVRMLGRSAVPDPVSASIEALADRWETEEAINRISGFIGK